MLCMGTPILHYNFVTWTGDATVIADPYEAYLREHKHGEPDMVVAAESNVLQIGRAHV